MPQPPKLPWSLRYPQKNVARVDHKLPTAGPGLRKWEHWTWIGSDIHYDSPDCDRDYYHATMQEAVARKASVIQVGDIFDVMVGPGDRRGNARMLRDELMRSAYFDDVVNGWVEDHIGYAGNLAYMGYGNHETSVIRHYETDLLDRALQLLRLRTGAQIMPSGYSGWAWYTFRCGNHCTSRRIKLYHGSGGGGPVTRDTIQLERHRARLGDHDIFASGHTHDKSVDTSTLREGLDSRGHITETRQVSIKLGTFKRNTTPNCRSSWETEKGIRAKAVGGHWIRWYWASRRQGIEYEVREMMP